MEKVRGKEMVETRKKHAQTIHLEGRLFTENCLIERPRIEVNNKGKVAETQRVIDNHPVRVENATIDAAKKQQSRTKKNQ